MKTAFLSGLLAALAAWDAVHAETPATPVQVEPVAWCSNAIPVRATGVLALRSELDLAFPAAGVLQAVNVRAGDTVRKGATLAQLDLDDLDARVAQARATAEQARRDAARSRTLRESRVIGAEEDENAQTALARAEAALQSALFLRRYAVIEAPNDGRVIRRIAEPGQMVDAGQPILRFAMDNGWLVRVALADREVTRLHIGDRAWIETTAAPGAPVPAVVTQIAAGSDPRTRTTEVELTPETAPDHFRSGFIVHVTLHPQPVPARPRVPLAALVEGQGRTAAVFVAVSDATAQRHEVEVEAIDGTHAYLRTPLPEGAPLVTRGAEFLRDGVRIRGEGAATP